jgi:serine/threonine-protein kinase RsbW
VKLIFDLLLPRDRLTVPMVRHLFSSSLAELGVASGCIEELELAITEACSNALKHARSGEDQYEVAARVDGTLAEVTVTNLGVSGLGSDAEPALDAESGRGVLLMSHLVDHFSFEQHEESTSVKLSKKLTLVDDSVLAKLPSLHAASG